MGGTDTLPWLAWCGGPRRSRCKKRSPLNITRCELDASIIGIHRMRFEAKPARKVSLELGRQESVVSAETVDQRRKNGAYLWRGSV